MSRNLDKRSSTPRAARSGTKNEGPAGSGGRQHLSSLPGAPMAYNCLSDNCLWWRVFLSCPLCRWSPWHRSSAAWSGEGERQLGFPRRPWLTGPDCTGRISASWRGGSGPRPSRSSVTWPRPWVRRWPPWWGNWKRVGADPRRPRVGPKGPGCNCRWPPGDRLRTTSSRTSRPARPHPGRTRGPSGSPGQTWGVTAGIPHSPPAGPVSTPKLHPEVSVG